MNYDNLEILWYWIREREVIRALKEKGCQPEWTTDPILQKYHFCNVHREDDSGTKDIRAMVLDSRRPVEELPWIYTMARLFNYWRTLRSALIAYNVGRRWEDMVAVTKKNRDIGFKTFNTAYVVSTCGKSIDKVDYVFSVVGAVARQAVPRVGLQAAYESINAVDGMGSFLAAQVVADLRNDRYLEPADGSEALYWSMPGPGSKKGLDYIWPTKTNNGNYQERIESLYSEMPPDIVDMNIHAQDLQNCLCEFSKYMRYLNKEPGRQRYYRR